MDSLVFRCPGCQQPFQVLAEQAGQMVRCPGCEEPVQIPESAPQAKPPAEKPAESLATSPANPSTKKPAETSAVPTPPIETNAEEVQPYECPECVKPFGIYPSMFGSQMACPHCQKTVLLKKFENPKTDVTAAAMPATKHREKRKQTLEPQPQESPKAPPKTESAPPKSKTEAKTTDPSKSEPADKHKEKTIAPPINRVPKEPAADAAVEQPAPAVATVFTPQSVEHLLPPKFQAVDPAFFYRRHQDGSQVLLPGEDGSVNVVDNRIVRIEHKGQTYELISSPRYDRIQKSIVTNLLAVVICGLVIAIVMTLLNQ